MYSVVYPEFVYGGCYSAGDDFMLLSMGVKSTYYVQLGAKKINSLELKRWEKSD